MWWREGEKRLTDSTAGVTLTPASLYHRLRVDLTSYSLSGDDIVCEVVDPENSEVVVASANFKITLPGGELNYN